MYVSVIARSRDCVASIAARYGIALDVVWGDPENAELRRSRESPYVLREGDVVRVPVPETPGCTFRSGRANRYRATVPEVHLRLQLFQPPEHDGAAAAPSPLAGAPYEIVVGTRHIRGETDSEGMVDQRVPARTTQCELRIWPGEPTETRTTVRVGALVPAPEEGGLEQRLANLGFAHLPPGDRLAAFQASAGLPVSGVLDDATRERLTDLHRA